MLSLTLLPVTALLIVAVCLNTSLWKEVAFGHDEFKLISDAIKKEI